MNFLIVCRTSVRLAIILAATLFSLSAADTEASPPNIVLIVADDLGWADVSYHNATRAETPNIDRLIAAGAELDRFYVAPMCSPTRAGLMTGRYPIRFGLARAVIPPQRNFGLDVAETTLPEALAELGYEHRGVFGKWHLGHHQPKWHPLRQGFTHFHGHYNGAIDYFQLTREAERDWHVDWQPSEQEGYATTLIADAASDWITEAAKDDRPYFCYVPFNAPHSPFQATQEDLRRYESKFPKSGLITEDGRPARKKAGKKANKLGQRHAIMSMIWRMDMGIGQLLDTIEASGEADNTIVWFTSDNGGVSSFPNNNSPLRSDKLTVFEGGIRVAAGVRWPGVVEPGSKVDVVCGYTDVLPTCVAAAGGNLSDWKGKPLDGVDLKPALLGEPNEIPARDWYSYHGQGGEQTEQIAVRSGDWKLVVLGPRLTDTGLTDAHEASLFEISRDPYETENVVNSQPEQVASLIKKLVAHRALQPPNAVPPYRVKTPGFTPPKNWRLVAD